MRIVEPKFVCRKKRGKEYCRWEIDVGVDIAMPYVMLRWDEWLNILAMADRYLALLDLVKECYFDKEYSYIFLREFLVNEMRALEKMAKEFEERGDYDRAEDTRFRIKVYTEELKWRKREYEKMKRVLEELGLV